MQYPPSIKKLIDLLSYLPTVGPKTAERYALWLLKQPDEWLDGLAQTIARLKNSVVYCSICHALSAADPCLLCTDRQRDTGLLCVVSETKDMLSLEDSRAYNGRYHILGGVISTINNQGPETLHINSLLNKLKNESISEVILALNPDFEGETTALYLKKLLSSFNLKISRLARGLPSGASLDYADQLTIANALKFRNKYN